ncbi:MAG: gas vesicle protein GvpG [Dehalococcoidales bacterium]
MLTGLLFSVLGVPVTLAKEIMGKLRDEIDKERLITEESIKQRLQQLQLLLRDGELNEEEYEGIEEQLIARLKAVREYQKSQEVK